PTPLESKRSRHEKEPPAGGSIRRGLAVQVEVVNAPGGSQSEASSARVECRSPTLSDALTESSGELLRRCNAFEAPTHFHKFPAAIASTWTSSNKDLDQLHSEVDEALCMALPGKP